MTANQTISHSPFFLPTPAGRLFCLYFSPPCRLKPHLAVLYFPPFAEEMNKARRMAVLQARQWASLGHAALLVDPFGTGDSEGEFADARWETWREGLSVAADWLIAQGARRLVFWGLRLGALLAVELINTDRWSVKRLVLWQPVTVGETFMTRFLRLRMVADLAAKQDRRSTQQLREAIRRGGAVEVAGYTLAPAMLDTVDALDMHKMNAPKCPRVDWFEVAALAGQTPSAAGKRVLDAWQSTGLEIGACTVAGDSFWCTPEITVAPALLDATSGLLARSAACGPSPHNSRGFENQGEAG